MINIPFSEEEREQLNYLRFHHPHPRVRKKIDVLWLKSQKFSHKEIARLSRITQNTMRNYFYEYLEGGMVGRI